MMKKKFNKYFLGLIIIISIALSAYIWYKATQWQGVVMSSDTWYSMPELSRTEIRDIYDLAFKKIILLNLIVFSSTFLWLKISEKR